MNIVKFLYTLAIVALPISAHAVEVERVVSPGGIKAWLVQDTANPLVSMSFAFQGGSELDPENLSGLANLAAGTMDEGAGTFDSQAFQQRLTDQSITLRFKAGLDVFGGQLKALSGNVDEAFELLTLALTQPRFDEEPLARLKSQIQSAIRRDSESPNAVAYEALFQGFFPGDGYARRSDGTVDSVAAITRQDLLDFVKARITRENLKIGVVGAITPARLGALLDATFGQLPVSSEVTTARDIQAQANGRLSVIEKDLVQSTIVFGHGGPKRKDPDFYATLIMNHILGGGSFTSRLYTQVREKRGLAYSVGASLYPLERAGMIVGNAGTENARVGETIDVVRAEWARMAAGDVDQVEVDNAKTYVSGSFPLRLTSTSAIAKVLVSMQRSDLGIDYLDRRNGYISAVTLDDVKRVAAKYLDPAKLDIVVVGKPEGIVEHP